MSRIAAAYFNAASPPGWQATSAGLEPPAQLGPNAPRLLPDTPVEDLLDHSLPRPVEMVPSPSRVVATCCEVPDADRWDLTSAAFTEVMHEEICERAEALARACAEREATDGHGS